MATCLEYRRASRRLDELDRKLGKAAREEAVIRKVTQTSCLFFKHEEKICCGQLARLLVFKPLPDIDYSGAGLESKSVRLL